MCFTCVNELALSTSSQSSTFQREVEALERECTITQDNAQALGQNFHYLETILNEKKQAFRLATRAHVEKQSEVEELQSRVNSHDTEIANLKR
jgi:predicted  nucleic acid-binding Zn-ribbon protein